MSDYNLALSADGSSITYTYDTHAEQTGITALLQALNDAGLSLKDLKTTQSSLEDIFVKLVGGKA
jgi:ABC-2 type transport system ATP-binding protein